MKRRLKGLLLDKLAQASVLLIIGSVTAGLLGYLFQAIMGRLLSPLDYGLFGAMMALFTVFSAPLGTLSMVVSRKISEYRARGELGRTAHFYRSINLRSAVAGTASLLVLSIFIPRLEAYLRTQDTLAVCLLGASVLSSVPPLINDAFLQGSQNFHWLSASSALRNVLKIIFSAALVWLGYGISGAMAGLVLSCGCGWLVTYLALRPTLAVQPDDTIQAAHLALRPAIPVLIANTSFAAMTQLDMVLVNHYFSAQESGLYAAASVLGKAVMYLPAGIAMALFPMVAENQARNESSAHLLFQAVGLTIVLCGAGAAAYFLFGERIISMLYGGAYRGAGEVLKYFGFAILPMALVMIAEYFLIAKGRVLFAYLYLIAAPAQLMAIHFLHESLQMVVLVLGASGAVLVAVGYGWLWWAYRAGIGEDKTTANGAGQRTC